MKILIVGAGAVGGTFGVKLAAGGHDVAFVARGDHGAAIRERGIVLEAPDGTVSARGQVFASVDQAAGHGAEVALVAVKWSGLSEVGPGTRQALAPDGVAIPLLNGLDVEQRLAELIGGERVVGGVAQLAASVTAPGVIELKAGGMLTLAPYLPEQAARVDRIAEAFSACFPCHAEPDLAQVRWQKLLWNAPFNAVCALTRRSAGQVLAMPALEALVRQVMREVIAVARAEGVVLEDSTIDAMIAITHGIFSKTEPSMLQDVLAGRETEADQLQGAVVARGQRHGVPTPALATLHALLQGLGPGARA